MRVKNKIGRLLISISIVLIGLLGVFSIFYKVKALNSFDITLTSNTEGYGSVYLDGVVIIILIKILKFINQQMVGQHMKQ